MTEQPIDPIPKEEPRKEPIRRWRIWLSSGQAVTVEAPDAGTARVKAYIESPPGIVVTDVDLLDH